MMKIKKKTEQSSLINIGCGSRIWTYDLWVMSPTSCQTAPSRDKYINKTMAEEKGFEPLRRFHDLLVFKTSPFSQTWVFLHNGASGRTWTGTWFNSRRILSPVRLPIPPLRQAPIMSNITGLLNCIIKLIIFQVFFLFSSNFYTKK